MDKPVEDSFHSNHHCGGGTHFVSKMRLVTDTERKDVAHGSGVIVMVAGMVPFIVVGGFWMIRKQ